MRALAQAIAQEAKAKDFKYKDVQKSTEARRLFLASMAKLQGPAGVYGLYAPGGSLLNEKRRAIREMGFLGSDDGGGTAEIARQIEQGIDNAHIRAFLGYFVPCMLTYAAAERRPLDIHWDRRSDLRKLQDICSEHQDLQEQILRVVPSLRGVRPVVSFHEVADGELAPLARLAGVVAGDVRHYFRKHGRLIWDKMDEAVRIVGDYGPSIHEYRNMMRITRLGKVRDGLGDPDFSTGSKETSLIRGYCTRFLCGCISFASPEGKMGHILVLSDSEWEIHQLPD